MLILASKSPRRKEILSSVYKKDFLVLPSDIDEKAVVSKTVRDNPFDISLAKGMKISLAHPSDYVLSADTIVLFANKEYGKPQDEQDAFRMLSSLNGKTHEVITGYHILLNGKDLYSGSSVSCLILHNLDKERITAYILSSSPFDKAGAYGIQDKAYIDAEVISGSYENIMGLPKDDIEKGLRSLKLI